MKLSAVVAAVLGLLVMTVVLAEVDLRVPVVIVLEDTEMLAVVGRQHMYRLALVAAELAD